MFICVCKLVGRRGQTLLLSRPPGRPSPCHRAMLLAKALQCQSAKPQLKQQRLSWLSCSWALLLHRLWASCSCPSLPRPVAGPGGWPRQNRSAALPPSPVQFWAAIHTHPAPTRDPEKACSNKRPDPTRNPEKASYLFYGRSGRHNNNWMKVCRNG